MIFLNVVLLIIVIVVLIVFLLFLVYDFIPFVSPILKNKYSKTLKKKRRNEEIEKAVLQASLKLIKETKMLMVWQEPKSISERIFNLLFINRDKNITYYNFPRAFLYYGLIEYLINANNNINLLLLKNEFDKILDRNGNLIFKLEKVDQAMFGATALTFYELYKEEKYLNFATHIYKFIEDIYDNNSGLVFYRKNSTVWYYDTLGMVLPFLVSYSKSTATEKALIMAKEQMALYIKVGMDKETYIPAHGVNLNSNIKVGSINWGRGLGWYMLGLESIYKYDGSFAAEYIGIVDVLLKLKNDNGLWSQFPGSSLDFDASASTMLLSCLPENELDYDTVLAAFSSFISDDGFLLNTSGDTYGANRYSETFGKSELSQGMLLYALSRLKK